MSRELVLNSDNEIGRLDLWAVEAGIRGTEFTGRLMHFASVGSTNALALAAAQDGARGGIWVADEQTAGRGRGGHRWHSAAGEGLYVSALVAPPLGMRMALKLSLSTGLAARSAIRESTGLIADLRWPNDLLLGGRKCGGILVETAVAAVSAESSGRPMLRYAVIGIGLNLNHTEFPPELRELATSLRLEVGDTVPREPLLAALLRTLDGEIRLLDRESGAERDHSLRKGPGVLERFSCASTWVLGKRVRVGEGDGYTGVTAGLDHDGFLLVDGDDGVRHTVLSGGVREEIGTPRL